MCGQSQAQPGKTEQQSLPARPPGRPGPVAEQPLQCGQLAQPSSLQQEHLQVYSQTGQERVVEIFYTFLKSQIKHKTRYLGTEFLYIPERFSPFSSKTFFYIFHIC